jgi:DNA polymerase III psi subunit
MAKKEIQPLAAFAVMAEAQAQHLGITVCQITHPDAIDGDVYVGAMSGIRLVKGEKVSAVLADGSTI